MSEDIKNQDEVTEASAPVANKGVVTPDKDPVPKSLASVDKAADSTKVSKKRKGDNDKKDAPQKLAASYEETENEEEIVVEDLTKMDALRKNIEELKGLHGGEEHDDATGNVDEHLVVPDDLEVFVVDVGLNRKLQVPNGGDLLVIKVDPDEDSQVVDEVEVEEDIESTSDISIHESEILYSFCGILS